MFLCFLLHDIVSSSTVFFLTFILHLPVLKENGKFSSLTCHKSTHSGVHMVNYNGGEIAYPLIVTGPDGKLALVVSPEHKIYS